MIGSSSTSGSVSSNRIDNTMTSTRAPSKLSDLQDVIECPICCLRFERPLQLNCGHSFCGNCVDRLIADARADVNREDNFFDAMGWVAAPRMPNVNREHDHPHQNNRREGEMWMQIPHAPPHLPHHHPPNPPPPLPGLGGFPQPHYLFRNFNPFEEPPFVHRRMNVVGGGGGGGDHIIKCPECRQPTRVPPEGLPINYRLQEVLARVAESDANTNNSNARTVGASGPEEGIHPRCLACNDAMIKGVYLLCRTCVDGNAHQLCSMCCIRNHNGHNIEERRFLTMSDVVAARDVVSEATGRSYQAVDHTLNEFNATTNETKELLQTSAQNALQAFEAANDFQFELLSCPDELDHRVRTAQEICGRFEQLPGTIKDIAEEYRSRIASIADEFVNNVLACVRIWNADAANEMESSPHLEVEPGPSLDENNTGTPLDFSSTHVSVCDGVLRRDNTRTRPMNECKNRRLRAVQKQCPSRRAYETRSRNKELIREGCNSNQWDLESDRRRREEGTGVTESVEVASEIPSAVTDIEHRAGRLNITPERHRILEDIKIREELFETVAQIVKAKHRRGEELGETGEGNGENMSGANGDSLPIPEPATARRAKRRKYDLIGPGPSSFFPPFSSDDMVDDGNDHDDQDDDFDGGMSSTRSN